MASDMAEEPQPSLEERQAQASRNVNAFNESLGLTSAPINNSNTLKNRTLRAVSPLVFKNKSNLQVTTVYYGPSLLEFQKRYKDLVDLKTCEEVLAQQNIIKTDLKTRLNKIVISFEQSPEHNASRFMNEIKEVITAMVESFSILSTEIKAPIGEKIIRPALIEYDNDRVTQILEVFSKTVIPSVFKNVTERQTAIQILKSLITKIFAFLSTVKCKDDKTNSILNPKDSLKTPIVNSIDTQSNLIASTDFDTPDKIRAWFEENDRKNYLLYLFGLGKILKKKQESLIEISTSLKQQISIKNDDYDNAVKLLTKIVPKMDKEEFPDEAKKKEELITGVSGTVNNTYQGEFFELLQKSIRYDETIEKLLGRRAYLVYHMNADDQGYAKITEKILKKAEDIYKLYKGTRYTDLRNKLFSFLQWAAFTPELIEKSFVMNTSITGPAGSGKTTLARELGYWYSVVGFLTADTFLENKDLSVREVGRPDLIAEYEGQTAPKVMGVLYSSLEKTLFIDEAYSVAGCTFENGKFKSDSYGDEFVSNLLPFIANHQGIGAVIVAGYKNLMELCFFQRNEGIPRRFPTLIDLPLYTTDELFPMLTRNIIQKQAASIKGSSKNFIRKKQILYVDLKAAIIMFHYNTAYDVFELMRKYLLLFNIRDTKLQSNNYPHGMPQCSYTILNHLLTCCLGKELRRNILRYHFYKEAFKFKASNLSFFPAQAGEMGLLADMVNKSIDIEINEQELTKGKVINFLTYEQEAVLFTKYFSGKEIALELRYFIDESVNSSVCVEIVKRGYGNKDFQKIIRSILIDKILPPEPIDLESFHKIIYRNDTSFIKRMITIYADLAGPVIDEILELDEKEFPVNMSRSDVITEKVLLNFYKEQAESSELYITELAAWESAKAKQLKNNTVTLQHPLLQTPGNESYVAWEDLGIDI